MNIIKVNAPVVGSRSYFVFSESLESHGDKFSDWLAQYEVFPVSFHKEAIGAAHRWQSHSFVAAIYGDRLMISHRPPIAIAKMHYEEYALHTASVDLYNTVYQRLYQTFMLQVPFTFDSEYI